MAFQILCSWKYSCYVIDFFKYQQKDYLVESYQYPNQRPRNSLTVIFFLDNSNTQVNCVSFKCLR